MQWRLTPEVVAEVNERLFKPLTGARENLKKTDAIIIFGGRSTSATLARVGARLREKGVSDRIIVAGGALICDHNVKRALLLNRMKLRELKDAFMQAGRAGVSAYLDELLPEKDEILAPEIEADYIQKILIEEGVPPEKITVGSREKHMNLIVAEIRKMDFGSATLIDYAPVIPRLVGTFRFQGDERPLAPYPVNVFGINPENWQKFALINRFWIAAEAENTDPRRKRYIGKYCSVVDWEEERRKNATLPPAPL